MECLDLIRKAEKAGLKVEAVGNHLIIRGPESAEALAQAILARKIEVLGLLSRESRVRSKDGRLRLKPGDSIQWKSSRFGLRDGRVVLAFGRESVLVQSRIVPSNLTLVDIDAVTRVGSA